MPTLDELMRRALATHLPQVDDGLFNHLKERKHGRHLRRRIGTAVLVLAVLAGSASSFIFLQRVFRGEEIGPPPAVTGSVSPSPAACQPAEVTADFEGRGGQDVARFECDAGGGWILTVDWESGASGFWNLDLCGAICVPWATPDIDGDGDAELLVWSTKPRDELQYGFVFVLDGYPSEVMGLPLRVLSDGTDDFPKGGAAIFPVSGDEETLAGLSCARPELLWTLSTRQDDGLWEVRTVRFEVHAGQREIARDRLTLVGDTTSLAFGPAGQPDALCNTPIQGPIDGRTPALVGGSEIIEGVPFPVCRPMSIPGTFSTDFGTAWVFERERVPGAGCVGSEGDQYLGIGTEAEVAAFTGFRGSEGGTGKWPFATPDVDGDGFDEVAIGIDGSRADGYVSFVLYQMQLEHGGGRIVPITLDCGSACEPVLWIDVDLEGTVGATCGSLSDHEGPQGLIRWFAEGPPSETGELKIEATLWLLEGDRLVSGEPSLSFDSADPMSDPRDLCGSPTIWPEDHANYPLEKLIRP